MDRAYHQSHRLTQNTGTAAKLMMEAYRRQGVGIFGKLTADQRATNLARAAWSEASYCIDAPELLPAGGMGNFEIPAVPGEFCPELLHVERP